MMYFSVGESTMAAVNSLGKITNLYNLGRYHLHHDYVFDGDGNIIIWPVIRKLILVKT